MGKFKVNNKTSILLCVVLLDFVSGLPHFNLIERFDEVVEKSGKDDSLSSSRDESLLLTRIRREILDDSEEYYEGETSDDEDDGPIQSRFGHHGHGHKSKRKGRNHPYLVFQGGVDYHSPYPLNNEYLPSIGSESWGYDPGFHRTPGFHETPEFGKSKPWNRGNGNKFGHVHNHDFYIPGHHHNHDCGPLHNGGHKHDQGHHYGYDNHPLKKPVLDKFPSNKSPTTSTTTTQKTSTLPKIDIRAGEVTQ
nr:uncharacterized protein LOC111518058 isoform X2 [Leptinotarsa decemlineata]